MKIRLALCLAAAIVLGVVAYGSQDFLLGVSRGTTVAPATTPCDLVSGCTAAYSVRRRVVATYTGNLFRLSKSGSTQDIGQSGTDVDSAAIHTFCGSNNANSCKYNKFYDQSGNANDLTCDKAAVSGASTACTAFTDDVPFTWVGSWGTAPVPNVTFTTGTNFFGNTSPTNLPAGGVDKSVVVVVNDATYSTCCGIFGTAHVTTQSPLVNGTDFTAMIRAGLNGTDPNWRRFGVDLELDVLETYYAPDDPTGYSTASATAALAAGGTFVGIISYASGSKTVLSDFNGELTYSATYATGITVDTNIRLGAGGDASRTAGVWSEGLIYNATLTAGNRSTLEANAQSYYSVTSPPTCSGSPPTTVVGTVGVSSLSGAWGMRALNTHWRGPVANLRRASDGTFKPIGLSACDFDTSTATTFCNATTCSVFQLYNQVMPAGHGPEIYTNTNTDGWILKNATAANQPAYTASCLGSLPCMTFTATQELDSYTTQAWPQPYTVWAVGKNTTSGTFGGMLSSVANFHPYLGRTSAANGVLFQADDGGGTSCASCATDGTFFALGGQANDGTHVSAWVAGTQTGPTVATVTNSTVFMRLGGSLSFTGSVAEAAAGFTNVSTGNMSTIATNQKSYWGY